MGDKEWGKDASHSLTNPRWTLLFSKEHLMHGCTEQTRENDPTCKPTFDADPADPGGFNPLRKDFNNASHGLPHDLNITMELHNVGLDSKVWIPIFSKQLGITSLLGLKCVGEESLQDLERFTCHSYEKKALRKLLCTMPLKKPQHKRQKEKLENRQDEVQKLLRELERLQLLEGHDRSSKMVQECESMVRQMFQIPECYWIPQSRTLEEIISQIQCSHKQVCTCLQTKKDLSDSLVVQTVSSGLALRGIMVSRKIEDQLETRSQLIRAPMGIQLLRTSHPPYDKTETFTVKLQEEVFMKAVDKLGYSITTLTENGFCGFENENSETYSDFTVNHHGVKCDVQESYYSTVRLFSMPLASHYFRDSDLHLSAEALKDVQEIDALIAVRETTSSRLQSECKKFFHKFGTHVNRGPLNFGAIYWWKCSTTDNERSDLPTIKKLHQDVISLHVALSYNSIGTAFNVDYASIADKLESTYPKKLIHQTTLEVKISGGPSEVMSLPEWKNALVASNSTWSLIDRGTTLVPVWKIIEMNHEKDLQKVSDIVQVLKRAYEVMTKAKYTSMKGPCHSLASVEEWNRSKDVTELNAVIASLQLVKEGVVKKSLNRQVWPSLYLSQPYIQRFLKLVTDKHIRSTFSSEDIKSQMQKLVERTDLNSIKLQKFPLKHFVSHWLYDTEVQSILPLACQDFFSLSEYLRHAMDFINAARVFISDNNTDSMSLMCTPTDVAIKVTNSVAKALLSFQSILRQCGQKYESIFVTALVYPFKHSTTDMTFKLLAVYDIQYLYTKLNEQSKFFFALKNGSKASIQAYLFLLLLEAFYDKHFDVPESHLQQHMQYFMQELDDELEPIIVNVLHTTEENALEDVRLSLELITKGLPVPLPPRNPDAHSRSKESHKNMAGNMYKQSEAILHNTEEHVQSASVAKKSTLNDSSKKIKDNVQNLFCMLNLVQYYPQKLSLHDALKFNVSQDGFKAANFSKSNQLHTLILQKIMAFDHRCRNIILHPSKGQQESGEYSDYEGDGSDDDSDDDLTCDRTKVTSTVAPMDGLIALFHCSDDFLRQDLMSRLVTCQLAIPLILLDPFTHQLIFPLRAMKTIVKEWKRTFNGKVEEVECPVVCYPTPIVSFLRFGKHDKSKSVLLNNIISDSRHDLFCHRDCEGGNLKRLLGEGLVEVSWYFAAGKPSDVFPDTVTFLNLHGDAHQHPKQVDFLGQISFMTFVLLTEEDLNESSAKILQQHSTTPGGVVLLLCVSNADKTWKQKKISDLKKAVKGKVCIIKLRQMNAYDIKKKVRCRINTSLQKLWLKLSKPITLGECTDIAHSCGIYVDEDNDQFVEGQKLACSFHGLLNNFQPEVHKVSAKDKMLPLQGPKMWQKWAENDREECRQINRGSEATESYTSRLKREKGLTRKVQLEYIQSDLSPFMNLFLTSLINNKEIVRKYFLQCLKYILDDLSRKNLLQLRHQYQREKKHLNELHSNTKRNECAITKCKEVLDQILTALSCASLGLEHLLRECCQVYEAVTEAESIGSQGIKRYTRLPKVAAELLAEGYPLELMDGDASHVPITWIAAVLHEAVILLHDPRVFVLSVLGLQSTGKSTLMNTMFGLQFSVSAGRCTRGAFVQLIPISEQMKEDLTCDYLLVVDTEGLRAPELDSLKTQRHDNELATFVIGIADLTLINIKGETPGEMDDILQTAVHAFLRMKTVNLNPTCQFVHQNVGAVMASSKGGMGSSRFTQKLDVITLAAAKEENCEQSYRSFSDVIQFHNQMDVHYFPSLWKGDPPMAPVNEGYIEQAQALKAHILGKVRQTSNSHLSQFVLRLSALWSAILHETFVFTFKNTIEINAYKALNAEYCQWAWILQNKILKWEQKAENDIARSNEDELKAVHKRLTAEVSLYVDEVYREVEKDMKKYFKESKQSTTLVQWQTKTQLRLKNLAHETHVHAERFCNQVVISKLAYTRVEDSKIAFCKQLQKECSSSAGYSRLTGTQLREKFINQWKEWIEVYKSNSVKDESIDIISSVQNTLSEFFLSDQHVFTSKLQHRPLTEWGDCLKLAVRMYDIKPCKRWTGHFNLQVDESYILRAQTLTDSALARVQAYLDSIQNEKFRSVHTLEILHTLSTFMADSQTEGFMFNQEYRVDLSLTVCGYAVKNFEKMIVRFKQRYDPIQYLEREVKEPLFLFFKTHFHQLS